MTRPVARGATTAAERARGRPAASRCALALALVAACGRVGYDELGDESAGGGADARSGDGTGTDGTGTDGTDGTPGTDGTAGTDGTTCASARTLVVGGPPLVAEPLLDGPSSVCGAGPDLIYRLRLTSSDVVNAQIRSSFSGATAVWPASCPPDLGECVAMNAGETRDRTTSLGAGEYFIVVERRGDEGTTFDLSLTAD